MNYRCVKIVNSAISYTDPISIDELTEETIEDLYEKKHNYGNVRPGLINNTYAITNILTELLNTVKIDLISGKLLPIVDVYMINNNSRYTFTFKKDNLRQIKLDEDLQIQPKSKMFILVENDKLSVYTKEELLNKIKEN